MRYGVVFPHGDEAVSVGADGPRRFALGVEAAGFDYLSAADHVLGADVTNRPDWRGPYTSENAFRELFVLFGFMAAITTRIELTSSIAILPQRQVALFAKQAAEVDQLTGGRLRLGLGVGWNAVEYEGLGVDFHRRGAICDEQLEVMRLLWTKNVVTYEGRYHRIDQMGILPLPVQQPIPIWLGGIGRQSAGASAASMNHVMDRIVRHSDGWIAGPRLTAQQITETFAHIRERAEVAGRDPAEIGIQASLHVSDASDVGAIERGVEQMRAVGVVNLTMETRNSGLSLEQNLELIGQLGEIVRAIGP